MAQFTNLPNEIIIMIAENVFPGDIVNFSASSKNIQRVSEPSLRKHHEMERRYKSQTCHRQNSPVSNLAYDIVLRPTVALYVECLSIDTWFTCWQDDAAESSYMVYPQEKMTSLKEAVVDFVPADRVPAWDTAIESGDEESLLALLLLQLSNVAVLRLRYFMVPCPFLFETVIRVLETQGAPYLCNLTTLDINLPESEPGYWFQDWQAINAFAGLPSLRSIKAWNIWVDEEYDGYVLRPRSSNVSSLTFKRSSIGAQQLQELLQGFKALKTISYAETYHPQHQFEISQICAALLTHAKASLEYLNLRSTYAEETSYMGSLRDFENLKEIHTDLYLLDDTLRSGEIFLAHMLPASVEKVHLHEMYNRSPEDVQDLILAAAEDKDELLPNLKQLHFRLYLGEIDAKSRTMIAAMQDICDRSGFELIFD